MACMASYRSDAIGLCWTLLTLVEPGTWTPEYLTIYKSATLLIALSISALSNFMIPYAVFLSFFPVLVALSTQAMISMHVLDISLAGMLATALSFFTYIIRIICLNRMSKSFLSNRRKMILLPN